MLLSLVAAVSVCDEQQVCARLLNRVHVASPAAREAFFVALHEVVALLLHAESSSALLFLVSVSAIAVPSHMLLVSSHLCASRNARAFAPNVFLSIALYGFYPIAHCEFPSNSCKRLVDSFQDQQLNHFYHQQFWQVCS